jgi:small subunit ribosomal protein S6
MAEAAKAKLPPREYEVIYIVRPDVDREISERIALRVADVISKNSGTLTLVENWGRRPLAYPIEHHKRGNYVYLTYLGDGALVAELERNLRLIDEVMRFQTVKLSDDPGEVVIDESRTKFEVIERVEGEEDDDLTLEQELGLVANPRARARIEHDDDMDDGDNDYDLGDDL